MFPASCAGWPAARASWNSSDAVVLLPFVPVIPIPPRPPRSASQRPVAVATATPASRSSRSSARWIDTPGERTTTSQRPSASTAIAPTTTSAPGAASSERMSVAGSSSSAITLMRAAGSRRAVCAANDLISRPAPQTPTAAPSRSENRTAVGQEGGGCGVFVGEREHACGIPHGVGNAGQHLGDEPPDDGVRRPPRVAREQPDRRDRLLVLTDALERLVPADAGQLGEPGEPALVVEQIAPEDVAQVLGRGERGEHEEDEAALRAVAAPRVPAQLRVEPEDRVAARERPVVLLHPGEGTRDRELRRRAQEREEPDAGAGLRQRRLQQPLGVQALAELVVHLDSVPDEVAARSRPLVRHRDDVE